MSEQLPIYVERGGLQIFPQPWKILNGDFYGFILPADVNAMQASICDLLFNSPMSSPGRFRPAGPFTMLVFNNLPHLSSTAPGWGDKGVLSEHEMAFWTLIEDTQTDRLLYTQTYMVVDKGRAVSTGREAFGFPKEYGWVSTPENAHVPDHFTAETIVVPEFGVDALEIREPLVTVSRIGSGNPAREIVDDLRGAVGTLWSALSHSGGLSGALRLIGHQIETMRHMDVPMIFLKQFRDVTDPTRACFQSVTEAVTKTDKVNHGLMYFDAFSVKIGDWASHPIRDQFGFGKGDLTPAMSFWVNMNFTVEAGKEIWRAKTDEGTG